jgi:predicted transcriptional regulator
MLINSLKGASFGEGLLMLRFPPSSQDLREFKYRDRVSIIGDILETVKNSPRKGKRKTQIMQSANLNYDQINKYLGLLITNGYIEAERSEIHRGLVYRVTSRGLDFVKVLEAENLRLR